MIRAALTRRNFLLHASLLSAAAALSGTLASTLESCKTQDNPTYPNGGNLQIVDATLEGGKVILTIDSFSPLVSVGAAAMAQYSGGALLVARASQSTFDAVSPTCTYQACTINTYSSLLYTCPCCGSQFSILGAVKKGPAGSALRQYPATFDGYLVTISI